MFQVDNPQYPTASKTVYKVQEAPYAPTPEANAVQVGGAHYKTKAIQPWDYIAANSLDYFQGNIVKYVSRWKDKGGMQDLEKARHYLDKYIELQKQLGG